MRRLNVQLKIDEDGVLRGISMWHPIFGEWVHINQIMKSDGTREYYTNGVKEEPDYDGDERTRDTD